MSQLDRALFLSRVGAYVPEDAPDETALRAAAREGVRRAWSRLPAEALHGVADVREPGEDGFIDVSDGRLLMAYLVVDGQRILARQTDPDPDVTEPLTTARDAGPAFFVSRGRLRFVLPERFISAFGRDFKAKALVAPYPDLFADPALETSDAFGADYLPSNLLDAATSATAVAYLRDRIARLSRRLPDMAFPDLGGSRPAPPKVDWNVVRVVLPEATVVGPLLPAPSLDEPAFVGPPLRMGEVRGPDDLPPLADPPELVLPSPSVFTRFADDEDPEMAQVALSKLSQDLAEQRTRLDAYQNELGRYQALYRSRLESWRTLHLEATPTRFSAEAEANLAKYRTDLERAVAVWQARVEGYRAHVQVAITDAQLAAERAHLAAQMSTDAAFRNEAERVQALLQDYAQRLRTYETDVAAYRTRVEAEASQIELQTRRATEEARMLAFDMSRAQTAFEEAVRRAEREAVVARPIRPVLYPY